MRSAVIWVPSGEFVAYGTLTLAGLQAGKAPGTIGLLLGMAVVAGIIETWSCVARGESRLDPPVDRPAGSAVGSTPDAPDAHTIEIPPGSDGLVDVRVELADSPELHLRSLRFTRISGDGRSRE